MAPPPNDDFANATAISGFSGTEGPVTIDEATTQASEPLVVAGGVRQTIWYDWTAPIDGVVQWFLDPELASGVRFGYLTIYTGASLGTLTPASFTIIQASGSESDFMCVTVEAGTVYHVQAGVDFDGGATTGTLAVRWLMHTPPANDDFANRIGISGYIGSITSDYIDSASTEIGEQFDNPDPGYQSIWYEWTAPSSGNVDISVDPNGDGPVCYVWVGPPALGMLTEVGGSNAGPFSFTAIAGVTYYIQIYTFGNYCNERWTLNWSSPTPLVIGNIRLSDPPVWRVFVTNINCRTLSILDHRSTDRQFMVVLNAPAYHSGLVASDDPEINLPFPNLDSPALLSHNTRFIFALRRESGASPPYVCRFSGLVMNVEDQGADAPTTRYTAHDPWQYMFNRPSRNPNTGALLGRIGYIYKAGTRASDIAIDVLNQTEAVDGETFIQIWDINDTEPLTQDFTIEPGTTVGEVWQNLVLTGTIDFWLEPIYEPINFPTKLVKLHIAPVLGAVRTSAIMAWDKPGNSLTSISRLVDGTRLANRVRDYGGQGGYPVPLQSDASSIATYGEYWAQQFFPSANNAVLVELAALADLQIRKNGQRTISFDPTPERSVLSLRDYQIGDYVPVWASRNLREPLGVDYDAYIADPDFPGAAGFQRIYGIPITLDNDGVERVTGMITSKDVQTG